MQTIWSPSTCILEGKNWAIIILDWIPGNWKCQLPEMSVIFVLGEIVPTRYIYRIAIYVHAWTSLPVPRKFSKYSQKNIKQRSLTLWQLTLPVSRKFSNSSQKRNCGHPLYYLTIQFQFFPCEPCKLAAFRPHYNLDRTFELQLAWPWPATLH